MNATVSDLLRQSVESAEPFIFRFVAYFMTSWLDDPAMLALAFC